MWIGLLWMDVTTDSTRIRGEASVSASRVLASLVLLPCLPCRSELRPSFSLASGDEETRTPDLLLAKEALYQLSYVP